MKVLFYLLAFIFLKLFQLCILNFQFFHGLVLLLFMKYEGINNFILILILSAPIKFFFGYS